MARTPYQFARVQERYTSARDMLRLLGLISLLASAAFWLPIQWQLVTPQSAPEMIIAVAFGLFLVLGPPIFVSFFIPWSPAANLIRQINMRTPGQVVALAAMIYLVYYAGWLGLTWWSFRPDVAAANLAPQQMIIGIIATIVAPALLWAPASQEELQEILRQQIMVERFRQQAEADMAIYRGVVLDAQMIAARGLFGALGQHGDQHIGFLIDSVMGGIEESIRGIQGQVATLSNVYIDMPSVDQASSDNVAGILQYVAESTQAALVQPAPIFMPPASARGETITLNPPVRDQDAQREPPREVTREQERGTQRHAAARGSQWI